MFHRVLGRPGATSELFVVGLEDEVLLIGGVVVELEASVRQIFSELCLGLGVFQIPDGVLEG